MGAARSLNKELLEQYVLAGSADTRPEKLRVLAEHFCDKIRMRVAENPAAAPELIWNLAHDMNHDVRVAAACNPSADESVRYLLVHDADIIVRHALAQSIETPRTLLELLADDDNGWVRGEALKSLKILDNKSGDEVGRQRSRKRSRVRIISRENAVPDKGLAS